MTVSVSLIGTVLCGTAIAQPRDAEIDACRSAPNATCLADVGMAWDLPGDDVPKFSMGADLLGQMGRVDDARVFERRVLAANGRTGEGTESAIEQRVAAYRDIAALRSGVSPSVVFEGLGDNDSDATMALVRLAGQIVSGSYLGVPVAVDEGDRQIVVQTASQLAGKQIEHLTAAGLLVAMGAYDEANAVLDQLPEQGLLQQKLPGTLTQKIGADRTLDIYRRMPEMRAWYYADLIEAEVDDTRARALLVDMRNLIDTDEDVAKWVGGMAGLVAAAANRGLHDEARSAEAELRTVVSAEADPVPYMLNQRARAGVAVGVDAGVTRTDVADLEAVLDTTEGSVRSSLASSIAVYYAHLGDAENLVRMLEIDGRWSWVPWPETTDLVDQVLDLIETRVDGETLLRLKADAAGTLASDRRANPDRTWARDMVKQSIRDLDGEASGEAVRLNDRLLRAATRLEDPELIREILAASALAALDSGDPEAALLAAYQHHRLAD